MFWLDEYFKWREQVRISAYWPFSIVIFITISFQLPLFLLLYKPLDDKTGPLTIVIRAELSKIWTLDSRFITTRRFVVLYLWKSGIISLFILQHSISLFPIYHGIVRLIRFIQLYNFSFHWIGVEKVIK